MLRITQLSKSYGNRTLFDEVTFSLSPGERLGLIGRNGSGKSTLFKLILDSEHPDSGSISLPRGYRVGHLAQHLEFHEANIIKEACLGLPEDERDQEYRAEIILQGLGFSEEDFKKAPAEFSGGFQIRLNLAKLLLSEPNLLLLDEPTNYLDIISVRWLSSFLRSWKDELIIISHDRMFMDSVTTDTMFIHRGKVVKQPGGTQKLYERVRQDEETYEKTRINEDKKRRELEVVINRFRAKASKAAMVQSKIKALDKMGQKEELQDVRDLEFQFCQAPFPGKIMNQVEGLTFSYPGGPTLIDDLSITIGKGDRIGVIGKNGKGKSTLLKLLNGELTPLTGEVRPNQNTKVGYFGQTNIARLTPNLTVEQEIQAANTNHNRTVVRTICGTMMFSGDDALKKISVLSGGEKSRVLLGRILALPTNFLLLDEPTNHLDMESIEALVDSLKDYEGAVVIVTHSELILRDLVNRLVIFEGEVPRVLEHGYDYFLEKEGWAEEDQGASKSGKVKSAKRANTKEDKAIERKISQIENEISKMEKELNGVEEQLVTASEQGHVANVTALSIRHTELQDEIKKKYSEFEILTS